MTSYVGIIVCLYRSTQPHSMHPGCAANGPGMELTQARLRPLAVLPVAWTTNSLWCLVTH